MNNLCKLSALGALCFAMIVFGACGGGSGGGGGGYSPGGQVVYPECQKFLPPGGEGGSNNTSTGSSTSTDTSHDAYNSCTKTATSSTTITHTGSAAYTVMNGMTYYRTGTDTTWLIYTGTSTSTSTQ